ncbi:DUF453-domain-containing protein [Lindgomyces ingoldianus]|uniref:DUF453-domain-containing protein n=1 Tax=Lindgomyces ingoldianus TaxID=673940 RepID=A0ACB6QX01_9PLEO|nr:DUF453-domain-containing protein [Lindgomyces ingoldianus]KAF2470600.1 DUF453-domain-containing protein [Lindgomyces ingoldianus]
MGAGISSLSKICLVERHKKHYIDYTFVGLGVKDDEVDVAGNCGNMSSAIGPYAYNSRLLPASIYEKGDGPVAVTIRNTNTMKSFQSTFDVVGGQAAVQGNCAIDGVTGTGAKIQLEFWKPFGSKTGKLLPTCKTVDIVAGFRATCLDGANPVIFVRADDVGIDGTILPNDLNSLSEKLELLEKIRRAGAVAMGLAKTEDEVPRTIPKIGIVSMSSTHEVLSGATVKSSAVDLVVRFISDAQPHRAIPLTAALTTAIAARVPGTIVEQLLSPDLVENGMITIGHASGRIQVNATMAHHNQLEPQSATVYRTARRLFEGTVFWNDDGIAGAKEERTPQAHSLGLAFILESRGEDSSALLESSPAEPVASGNAKIISSLHRALRPKRRAHGIQAVPPEDQT